MKDESNVQEQIDYYDRAAEKYDRMLCTCGNRDNRNHLIRARVIADRIRADDGGSIFEVGAGTGLHARWLLDHTPIRYTGIDVSAPMLRTAGARLHDQASRTSLFIADAHRLPLGDGTFDGAFCCDSLHHLSDPRRGVHEMVRVTKPGGRVAFMESNWKFPTTFVLATAVAAERNMFKISPRTLTMWGREAGLTDVRVERLLYSPPLPRSWARLWDAVDRGVARVPGLRRLSIMLLLTGRVPD